MNLNCLSWLDALICILVKRDDFDHTIVAYELNKSQVLLFYQEVKLQSSYKAVAWNN